MKANVAFVLFLTVGLPILAAAENSSVEAWKVDLQLGSIEAPRSEAEDGTHYYAFKNIPFAEPPVGDLRFKNPVAASSWTGVRNGSAPSPACPQMDLMALIAGEIKMKGNEDCLYLDVYVPKKNASEFPVMVWIHGGSFIFGSSENYNPYPFMKDDVVVVNIQYRLGTLGFLSTEDSVMSGNYGLKDQVLALQWVRDNIRAFGGDPKRVTIFGESAGGISVHLLMLSPMAKGLFHNAIAQSGTALFPGIIRDDHRHNAAQVGQLLNCSSINSTDLNSKGLYDCLKNVSTESLVKVAGDFATFSSAPQVMLPRVDGEFLPEHPAELLKKGKYNKVHFMTGITRDEGAFVVTPLLRQDSEREELVSNFSAHAPVFLMIEDGRKTPAEYMAKRMFAHYLGGIHVTEKNANEAVKMMTDYWFSVPMDLSAKMHFKDRAFGERIFLYELHHLGDISTFASPNDSIGENWVSHADDLPYLFDVSQTNASTNPMDLFMRDIMISLWTNFARTGNPTPDLSLGFKWSPVSESDMQYLILQPSPYMRNFTREAEMEFMTNLPTKQNEILFPERFVSEEY